MADDDFVPQLKVKVAGAELREDVYDVLTELRVETSLQLPDQIRLRFTDPFFELYDDDRFAIGDDVQVLLGFEGAPQKIGDCEITAISIEPGADGRMALVVTALGRDHLMHRGVELATFTDLTDSEIVQKIASKLGLTADADASATRHPHVTQATTNHKFVTERAARIGFRWWVDGDTLHFKKKAVSEPTKTVKWGEDLINLRVVASSASASEGADVRSWDADQQEAIVGTASSTVGLESIGTDAKGPTAAAKRARSMATGKRFQATIVTDDTESANNLAGGLASRAAAEEIHVRGTVIGDPSLHAGVTLEILDIGTRLSGKYHVASVEHIYKADTGYLTRFMSGGQEASQLADLLHGSTPSTAPWDAHSLVVGVVSNIEDPDRPSRVKVRFPTFSDEYESAWARIASAGAGPDRGLHIVPEIDDEVLVGFEHGNPQRPIVLGGMWSTKLAPPASNETAIKSGKVATRTWKSRSGHSITINDAEAEGEDSIVVQLADGMGTLRLGKDKVLLDTPVDIEITTKKSASLVADGDVMITGANVTITAQSDMKLDAAQFTATASASAALEGATVDIKGSAKVGVDGGALTEVKGGMVKLN